LSSWKQTQKALLVATFALVLAIAPAANGRDAAKRDLGLGGIPHPAVKHAWRGLLVKFAPSVDGAARVAAAGDEDLGKTKTRVHVVRIGDGESLEAKLVEYRSRGDVVYAEPNYIASATSLARPDDPAYDAQWSLAKGQAIGGWSLFPGSYDIGGGAKLAIVDTGVDLTHPDLVGQLDIGDAADCVTESNACTPGSALDEQGHGTHTTGIAAATANNGVGVAGVAFASSVMPVKVLDANGSGTYASVANGIVWAAQHGARVISLSLGGYDYSDTLCDAVATATNTYHALVVGAAGNEGVSDKLYPAACPGAIGVAATNAKDRAASWSNFGAPDVFVSAPGVAIFSTYLEGSYETLSGTSMATPFVSGLAALLFGQDQSRSPADVKEILARSADKVGSVRYGTDPYGACSDCTFHPRYGYGRINVDRALGGPDFTLGVSPKRRVVKAGGRTSYTVSAAGSNGFAGVVDFAVVGLPAGSSWSFSPRQATQASTLRVRVPVGARRGNYRLGVIAAGEGLTRSVNVSLKVTR
jgi:thermitase